MKEDIKAQIGPERCESAEHEIAGLLHTKWAGRTCFFYRETDTTNADAKKLAEEGAPHGTLVVAERQTAGRGRRGRVWESSDAGEAIYMTLMLKPDFSPDHASCITLLTALAVTSVLEELCGEPFQIKWPNDVTLHGRKVCGILTEMSAEAGCIRHMVIGIGINLNQREFPQEICETATSVLRETGRTMSRAQTIAHVLLFFEQYYEQFLQTYDLSAVRERYERYLANKDREVRVLDPKGEFDGIARGIADGGELIVERPDGERVEVYAGEVSVRGLYGYV